MKTACTLLTLAIFITCILLLPASAEETAYNNECPIILVHGFGGWGPDEMEGLYYWGGRYDLRDILAEAGYRVHVATVGALSSNWDRAIELYYQIKGGQVDYGEEHSATYGHLQRPEGKTYDEPIYPEWDADHPVHLVGHSMGGQTIRMLSSLLAGREPQFQNVLRSDDDQTFIPGEGWIKSISTISSPHCGSSLFEQYDNPLGIASTVLLLAGVTSSDIIPAELYSFDLEQWDLVPEDNETMFDYLHRVYRAVGDTMDISFRELSTHGAKRFNTMVNFDTMDTTARYFSFANEETFPVAGGYAYLPEPTMNPIYIDTALKLGLAPDFTDRMKVGPSWRENDGVVNTASMRAPLTGCGDSYVEYDGTVQTGTWNFMGTRHWDHFDILGHTQGTYYQFHKFVTFHTELAELLTGIE